MSRNVYVYLVVASSLGLAQALGAPEDSGFWPYSREDYALGVRMLVAGAIGFLVQLASLPLAQPKPSALEGLRLCGAVGLFCLGLPVVQSLLLPGVKGGLGADVLMGLAGGAAGERALRALWAARLKGGGND